MTNKKRILLLLVLLGAVLFVKAQTTMPPPILEYPENGFVLTESLWWGCCEFHLSWKPQELVEQNKFHLQIARDSTDFTEMLFDDVVEDTMFTEQVWIVKNESLWSEITRDLDNIPIFHLRWRVKAIRGADESVWSEERILVLALITSNEEDSVPEQSFDVELYPNPVEKTLSLSLKVTKPSQLNISIYDVLGRKIGVDASYVFPIGEHQKALSMPSGLPKGFYVLVVQGQHQTLSKTFQVTR